MYEYDATRSKMWLKGKNSMPCGAVREEVTSMDLMLLTTLRCESITPLGDTRTTRGVKNGKHVILGYRIPYSVQAD